MTSSVLHHADPVHQRAGDHSSAVLRSAHRPGHLSWPSSADQQASFRSRWTAWRSQRDARLAAPYGFLSVTALHWLTEQPQRFEGLPGVWETGPAGIVVSLADGEELHQDELRLTGTVDLGVLPERGSLLLQHGDVVLEVARRGGLDLLRPRHPDHPLRTGFRGTPAYPPHPAWVVTGRYVAFDRPRPTTVESAVDGLQHVYDAPGYVVFELWGTLLALTAFPAADGGLLLQFTDATSGVTSYAAGRFVEVPAPDVDGRVVLDFNRTANLPCAYTDLATCPLPPEENRLPVAVETGEQTPYERR